MEESVWRNRESGAPIIDPEWDQAREIVRMIQLIIARIEMALRESEESVDMLCNSFTSMIGGVNTIYRTAASLGGADGAGDARETLFDTCETIRNGVSNAVIALQFFDRFSQRLGCAERCLDALTQLIGSTSWMYSQNAWKDLREQMMAECAMEGEWEVFDAILAGQSARDVLKNPSETKQKRDAQYDVGFF